MNNNNEYYIHNVFIMIINVEKHFYAPQFD